MFYAITGFSSSPALARVFGELETGTVTSHPSSSNSVRPSASPSEHGHTPPPSTSDELLGIETNEEFARFHQINDIFTRAFWDDTVRSTDSDAFFASYRMEARPKNGPGFTQKDFALRNAAWEVSNVISERAAADGIREGFQAPIINRTPPVTEQFPVTDAVAESAELKQIAKMFGADLVGITAIDERWHYASRVDTTDISRAPNDLPEGVTHVIVMGHAMDPDLVDTYPSALAGASTGMEYSHEAAIVIQLANYISNLGYIAVGSMNDTALVIPYAIQAGLGEYGRNQMVLTPEYGPRVRFSKIFTNMPLAIDHPRPLGIKAYCDSCTKCASACPPRALPFGPPTFGSDSPSTIKGVKKWSANCEKCFGFWAKLRSDCAICMRVCPFNRTYDSVLDRLWRRLATSRWRALAQLWDKHFSRQRQKPEQWWTNLTRNG